MRVQQEVMINTQSLPCCLLKKSGVTRWGNIIQNKISHLSEKLGLFILRAVAVEEEEIFPCHSRFFWLVQE